MKKYMKHANRGLLLTAAVLVIMIIYIIVDYIQFATQKSAVQDSVTHYMDAVFNANIENRLAATAKDNYAGLIEQYYAEDYNTTYYMNQSLFLSQIEEVVKPDCIVAITDAECQIQSISIKKSGTGMANVTVEYTGSFVGRGDSVVLSPGGIQMMSDYDDMYYYVENPEEIEKKDYTKNYNFSYQGEARLSMIKENGTWKIASLESDFYNSTFDPVDGQ